MTNEPAFTARDLLDAIIARASVVEKNPELFTGNDEWKSLTNKLDGLVGKLRDKKDPSEQQKLMGERDAMVRRLIIVMRTQLAQSYLFDDLQLQDSHGCTLLRDYAELIQSEACKKTKTLNLCGHKCDGIKWDTLELSMMPDNPKRRFDFCGSVKSGWEYCGCLDHAISNLACKVWGFCKGKPDEPGKNFNPKCWRDSSLYLAVLLSFGVNILEDQKFLESIDAHFGENPTALTKLREVLSVSKPSDFWRRTKEIILSSK